MLPNIKQLEELAKSSVALIKKLEDENAVLKQQVEALNTDRLRMIKNSPGARELALFKDKVRKKISRIIARIDKTITLQDTLFGEEFDDKS